MGRVVDLLNDRGERVPSIISIDRQTNEITDLPVRRLRIPEKIGNTELTKQEQDMLRARLPLKNKEIELANGRKFTTTLQANVEEKGVEFVPRGNRQRNGQEQKQDGSHERSKDVLGVICCYWLFSAFMESCFSQPAWLSYIPVHRF